MITRFSNLYKNYVATALALFNSDDFYSEFLANARDSFTESSVYIKRVDKKIDVNWVEMIEECIPSIDFVVRNPRTYIKDEEEILPIELSRHINNQSIRHLAQHTNFISAVEGDKITPSKILNVYKEESWETYENKFVNTLINRLTAFIIKRYDCIFSADSAQSIAKVDFNAEIERPSGEEIDFKMSIQSSKSVDDNADADVKNMTIFERISRLREIVNNFGKTDFAMKMKGQFIRPPVVRTNAILKDSNLKKCLALWLYIESYEKAGFEVNVTEKTDAPSAEYLMHLQGLAAFNYTLLKHYTDVDEMEFLAAITRSEYKKLDAKNTVLIVDNIMKEYNVSEQELKRLISNELDKRQIKRHAEIEQITREIDIAVNAEREYQKNLAEYNKQIEQQRKEELEKKAAKERERLARQKKLDAERAVREKELEKERLAREKAKQLEKEKAAKERAKQLEKARIEREKAKEKERLAREKARQLEKEKAAKEREKQLEKARIEREKAKEKERLAREKARQLEKEKAAKLKAAAANKKA